MATKLINFQFSRVIGIALLFVNDDVLMELLGNIIQLHCTGRGGNSSKVDSRGNRRFDHFELFLWGEVHRLENTKKIGRW